METGNFENNWILLLDILKEIKDKSEIKAKSVFLSSFQMWIQMIEWEDRDILLIKKFRGEVNWASGILTIFLISEDIEPWYSYRQYSYKTNTNLLIWICGAALRFWGAQNLRWIKLSCALVTLCRLASEGECYGATEIGGV